MGRLEPTPWTLETRMAWFPRSSLGAGGAGTAGEKEEFGDKGGALGTC